MIWWLVKFCAVCSLLAIIGWLFLQQNVHSKLSTTIQNQLNEKLAGSPLSATIGGAQFIEGQGIRLNNFRLTLNAIETADNSLRVAADGTPEFQATAGGTPAQQPASQIEIYEAFVHVPVSMTELVSCKTKPAAIQVRRARIRLNQNTSGDWNLPALWDEIQKLRDPTCGPVPFSCTDCTIELVSTHSTTPLQITDVGLEVLPIRHEGRSLIQIRGHLNSQLISNTDFTLFFDLTQKTWMLEKFSVAQIELSPAILQMLPATLSRSLTQSFRRSIGESPNQTSEKLLDVSGRIAITGSASGDMDFQTAPQFRCDGQLTNFNFTDARLPLPIQHGQLKFAINNDEIAVTQIQGMLGNSPFEGEYRQVGVFPCRTWDAHGRITDFDFTHHEKLTPSLPEFCEKLCEEYSPAGLSDIQFRFQHDGTQLTRDIRGQLTDMSFSYNRLPYAVDHCVGEILLHNDICEFEIRNGAGQPEMKMDGVVQNVGPNATYKINLLVPGELPIDDKMLTALAAQPTMAKIINDFNPSGRASGIGLIIKQIPNGPVSKSFDIRLKQCNVRHNSFQYPIHNVSGLVQIRNDQYSFADITGSNSSAEIRCNGTWNPTAGLNLIFNCSAVPLDNQLRFALNPDLREIWAGFRPRGTVDQMRVEMQLPIGAPSCLVAVDANLSKPVAGVEANLVSINPTWFPYEIRRLTGNIKIGNGKVQLSNMEGLHGKTWVVCQGDGHYSDDSWSVKLKNMLVTSLKVDEDLIAALPANLAPPIRGLAFQGLLNVHGEITLAGQEKILIAPAQFTSPVSLNATNSLPTSTVPNAPTAPTTTNSPSKMTNSMAWDLRFDMNQAKMQVGLPLENVFGKVNLTGQYDGENATCSGELNIDSLTIHDAQITKISGPIWLDNSHTAAGAFADQAKLKLANSSLNATPNVAPNLAQNANPNFSPLLQSPPTTRSVTGSMHGGVIRFDARMSSDPAGEFHLQTTLADGNLAQFCREFAPQLTDISGHSFAALRLAGNYRGTHSYRGTGTIQLREAKIYELPVMLSLLKILKVGNADRTAFDTSNANFTIDGEDIYFDRIEMLGDAISLVGNGTMNLDRDIDLNFYSIMGRGRFNIPLVSKLYHASSQQILWINVNGTLDEPRTHRNVLPQVNDSLKQLFQPAEPNAFVREWNRSIGIGAPVQSGLEQNRAEPQGAPIEREANRSSSLFR